MSIDYRKAVFLYWMIGYAGAAGGALMAAGMAFVRYGEPNGWATFGVGGLLLVGLFASFRVGLSYIERFLADSRVATAPVANVEHGTNLSPQEGFAVNANQQTTLQGPFKPNAAASVDMPEAPFGDRGLHVAFFKQEARVELDGSFTIDQIRTLLAELDRRAAGSIC